MSLNMRVVLYILLKQLLIDDEAVSSYIKMVRKFVPSIVPFTPASHGPRPLSPVIPDRRSHTSHPTQPG